jgi:hypothetical protein
MLYRLELYPLSYQCDGIKTSVKLVVASYVFELFAENSECDTLQWLLCGAEEIHIND